MQKSPRAANRERRADMKTDNSRVRLAEFHSFAASMDLDIHGVSTSGSRNPRESGMVEVIVSGSINDFGFGPAHLQIAKGLSAVDEAHAVLDAILHADIAEQDELTIRRVAREGQEPAESPQDRATHYGFTELQYKCPDGRVIKIL
jgi:hypothetical protein